MNSVSPSIVFGTEGSEVTDMVSGDFVDLFEERWYAIRNVDRIAPFLISLISSSDHWLFISSNGGLTAGRVSPATALFPYVTVDKIHDSYLNTGSKTILRVRTDETSRLWEPFNREHDDRYSLGRNLYRNVAGNKLCLEEINHDLQLAFRCSWMTSDEFGFVRESALLNLADKRAYVDVIDGLQNILPAGTPPFVQTNSSNLADAYKWSELDETTGLACLTLYSAISDRPEPRESLKATTVFCVGLPNKKVLLSSQQLYDFRATGEVMQETHRRGIRGGYLINSGLALERNSGKSWRIIADIEQTQSQVVALRQRLADPADVNAAIAASIASASEELSNIMARADGLQETAEENVSVHHYANVLFNVLRGGIFENQYTVSAQDFRATTRNFNRRVYEENTNFFSSLPERQNLADLRTLIAEQGDLQLDRLSSEYLPITFGRRHGDPSRPWNQFSIRVRDENGDRLLTYEGNWRDIFQNWEALAFSYPEFIENMVAKFVNASTIDGHNPYRITKEGIDWEVEEPDDPWSNIGYWGDHQIIYLQKLLELSRDFHPRRLRKMLRQPRFCYANVPYRIAPLEAQLANPKSTVTFDHQRAERIEQRVSALGADGKMLLTGAGDVYQVNLLEKLLVPILSKLGNLVIDGGIWLNTQRPEWNDANNALVGHGLSMVTVYYMSRYVRFLRDLLAEESGTFAISNEVSRWLGETTVALENVRAILGTGAVSDQQRYASLVELGQAATRYREEVYGNESFSGTCDQPVDQVVAMLADAQVVIDHTIQTNRRPDGLYHAYNLLDPGIDTIKVDRLYPMLEGQVAALSAGDMSPTEAVEVVEALFASDMYCPVRNSFMLYPDRELPGFLEKNRIPADHFQAIPLLERMVAAGDTRIVLRDADGQYRFNADLQNAADLRVRLAELGNEYQPDLEKARDSVADLYEDVFRHKAFTGRSGTMFGYEGVGSIYWHMVSKLMLAILENFFAAIDGGAPEATCRRLGELYYRVRKGIGFNKTPAEYGAIPTDPYSHTPKYGGAKQPGMTGQVKEEVLCRFGELGVRVSQGTVEFRPALLRAHEFLNDEGREFRYLDVGGNWRKLAVPKHGLAFTWCQVPILYVLDDSAEAGLRVTLKDGTEIDFQGLALPASESEELTLRSGRIRQITATFGTDRLLPE